MMARLLAPAPLFFDADSGETAPGQTKPRLLLPAFFDPGHQTQTALRQSLCLCLSPSTPAGWLLVPRSSQLLPHHGPRPAHVVKTLLRLLPPQPLRHHGAHVVKTLQLRPLLPQPLLPHGAHVVRLCCVCRRPSRCCPMARTL